MPPSSAPALRGEGFRGAHRRFTPGALGFPRARQGVGPPLAGALRGRHGPHHVTECCPCLGGHMRHAPRGRLGSQRGPGARDAPGAPCQRPDRVPATRGPRHTPHHPSRACRTGRGRCAPPDAMAALPLDLARRPLESAAAQCVPQRFALCGAQEPLQLLGQSVECRHGLTRFSTLTQKGLELLQGVRSTGQECPGRPCLPGGSPLG